MRQDQPSAGDAFEIFRVDAIDAGALLHQIAGPGAGIQLALLIGEAGGAAHSGGRRRPAFPCAGRVDAGLPIVAKKRSDIPAFLPGLTDYPRLEEQFGRGKPVQPCGAARPRRPMRSKRILQTARRPRRPHVLPMLAFPSPPHHKPGGNLLRRPFQEAGFVPAIDVLLLGAQHKDARVRHKGLISS